VKDWEERRDHILSEMGNRPLNVLIVEGPDDKSFIESLLNNRKRGQWESSWIVGVAAGKSAVLKILRDQPTWSALIDKDEWTEDEVNEQEAAFPGRLFVMPRFCMENYHVVPHELWAQLEAARQQAVQGGFQAFEAAILQPLDQWVIHGALWHAANPLQASLQARGFKTDLLDFNLANGGDAAIEAKLKDWHDHLEPRRVMGLYKANLATAQAATVEEQLKFWVHGKHFFRTHVKDTVARLTGLPPVAVETALANLQSKMLLPVDLRDIWTTFLGLP
jgi:hypothetical protein